VGLIGLLETKIKENNVNKIANYLFPRWEWIHKFQLNHKGRIWVAWNPTIYNVIELHKSDQYIHCKVTQQHSGKDFCITFVYGDNHDSPTRDLWEALKHIASTMDEAWCVLGDFNSMLYTRDRIGGTEIQDFEIRPFADCLATCELQELRYRGPYFSWTNKTIWSRIDQVFTNTL